MVRDPADHKMTMEPAEIENTNKFRSDVFLSIVIASGSLLILASFITLPYAKLDAGFLVIAVCTIALGSRITLPIPKFRSHISVADTFIFLTLLIYGGQAAIILAAAEAFVSSRRFCSKYSSIFFNSSSLALSTGAVFLVLYLTGLTDLSSLRENPSNIQKFLIAISLIALTQFLVNTAIAALHDSLRRSLPIWSTWKEKYIWTFFSYFIGAVSAGFLIQLIEYAGLAVVVAAMPVMLFVFLTYRMYMQNVEISINQAEQAEQYANVLEKRTAELLDSEERFRSAFNYAPIGIALVTPNGKWHKVNRALCTLLGHSAAELKTQYFLSSIFPEDREATLKKIEELQIGHIPSHKTELRFIHSSGKTVWSYLSISSASDRSESSDLIFQIQDISDRKIAEEKLQYEATHDPLTGLPNRALFMTRLAEAMEKSKTDKSHRVSVLFIDLDRFKYVNDSLGHVIGDELLINISHRLGECLRPDDIVARLGGDEFTIIVEGNFHSFEVASIAEAIHQKLAAPFTIAGNVIYSSASIGILHASGKHRTPEDIMRDADTAMYQAKRSGKARHEVFNDEMHRAAKETLQLETDLRHAIAHNEITLVYQPIFSLATGQITGVEALARWNHPSFGDVPPSKFIPLAEEIGCIDALGRQFLQKACGDIAYLLEENDLSSEFKLSMNISSKQLGSENFSEHLKKILLWTKFDPSRLKLEITESIFFDYQDRAIDILTGLRSMGIEFDIDDFGTGYCNLSYLVRLPISTLKIDRSFITPIKNEGANTEVVEMIIALSKNLGLDVVAEGIETNAQLQTLKALGCKSGQGFAFSRPLTLQDLGSLLKENATQPYPITEKARVAVISTIQ